MAIDYGVADHDARNATGVGDVVERVGIEDQEVGALAGAQHAGVAPVHELGGDRPIVGYKSQFSMLSSSASEPGLINCATN